MPIDIQYLGSLQTLFGIFCNILLIVQPQLFLSIQRATKVFVFHIIIYYFGHSTQYHIIFKQIHQHIKFQSREGLQSL